MSASRAWNRWLNPEVDRATEWQRVEAVLAKHFEDMSGHVSPHLAREAEGWRVVSAMTDTGHEGGGADRTPWSSISSGS